MSRTNTLVIRTPEGILFSLPLAGPIVRFLAWSIDVACIGVLVSLINRIVDMLQVLSEDAAGALLAIAYFAVSIGYGIFLEWRWRGQTLGKRLLRLRVVDQQGMRPVPSQIVIRNLLRFVDSLPVFYLVGGMACVLSRHAQRLGDFAAGTVVVRNPRHREPDLDQILGGRFNSLAEHPHLAARLKQRVTPQEAGVALRALLRRDQLDPEARLELFRDLAAHFRAAVEFPLEATESLADEQYVRNVLDILFRGAPQR